MKVRLPAFLIITLAAPLMLLGQPPVSRDNSADRSVHSSVSKIVIDPGHGGKHPGCVHKKYLEKDITLSIALKLGELIKKNFPDVQVIYTRTSDKYVDLADRGKIANQAAADLFLSIHINSAENTSARGTSTFVMGTEKSSQNLDVAMKENDVIIYEDDYKTKYEGYTPGDPSSYIMFSLMQYAHQEQSMLFADIIQKHFKHDLPMPDRGALQDMFLVLWRTTMPSVLTEIGFLSNSKDREYITTNKGQSEAARSLFNAFSEYKSKVEGRASVILLKEPASGSALSGLSAGDSRNTQINSGQAAVGEQTNSRPQNQTTDRGASHPQAAASNSNSHRAASASASAPGTSQGANTKPAGSTSNQPTTKLSGQSSGGIRFYVQVAFLSKQKPLGSSEFKSYRGKVVEMLVPGRGYRYLVGGTPSYDEILNLQAEVRREFKDAFVVAYDGDRQIGVEEARGRVK